MHTFKIILSILNKYPMVWIILYTVLQVLLCVLQKFKIKNNFHLNNMKLLVFIIYS